MVSLISRVVAVNVNALSIVSTGPMVIPVVPGFCGSIMALGKIEVARIMILIQIMGKAIFFPQFLGFDLAMLWNVVEELT